jgi:hypothetical protein
VFKNLTGWKKSDLADSDFFTEFRMDSTDFCLNSTEFCVNSADFPKKSADFLNPARDWGYLFVG